MSHVHLEWRDLKSGPLDCLGCLAREDELRELREALKKFQAFYKEHYPTVAGRVIGLEKLQEENAYRIWAKIARDLYNANAQVRVTLAEEEK